MEVKSTSQVDEDEDDEDELDDPRDSLVQPHAAQVIAIFRLLGIGSLCQG